MQIEIKREENGRLTMEFPEEDVANSIIKVLLPQLTNSSTAELAEQLKKTEEGAGQLMEEREQLNALLSSPEGYLEVGKRLGYQIESVKATVAETREAEEQDAKPEKEETGEDETLRAIGETLARERD